MRYEIKAISIWSFVKVSFFVHLLLSPIVGLLFPLLIGVVVTIAEEFGDYAIDEPVSGDAGAFIGIVILFIFFAVMYTAFATFCSFILAGIYNLIAKLIGGFEVTLDLMEEEKESIFVANKDSVTTYLAQTPAPQFSAPAASDIVSANEPEVIEESDDSGRDKSKNSDDNDREGDRPQI